MISAWLVASAVLILVGLDPPAATVVAAVAVVVPKVIAKVIAARTVDVQVVRGRMRRWP